MVRMPVAAVAVVTEQDVDVAVSQDREQLLAEVADRPPGETISALRGHAGIGMTEQQYLMATETLGRST
jgi:hypothetical protein